MESPPLLQPLLHIGPNLHFLYILHETRPIRVPVPVLSVSWLAGVVGLVQVGGVLVGGGDAGAAVTQAKALQAAGHHPAEGAPAALTHHRPAGAMHLTHTHTVLTYTHHTVLTVLGSGVKGQR